MNATPARIALGLCLFVLSATPEQAAKPSPSSVPVKTSRGEYRLLCFPPRTDRNLPLVLLISGEGGWRKFDDLLGGFFSDAGYWVGGIDSMKYFWHAQDDRTALAADMRAYARALARTAGRPQNSPLILAGFSFGADLAPWIAGAGGWKGQIAGLVMLGPDEVGSLQFRILEVFGYDEKDHVFPVAAALDSSAGIPTLFLHGGDDPHSAAPVLAAKAAEPKKILVVPGGDHHFSGREDLLRTTLTQGLEWLLSVRPEKPGLPAGGPP